MDRFEYIISKRPNYEKYSAAVWFGGAASTFAVSNALTDNLSTALVVAPAMVGLGAYRGYQAYKQHIRNRDFTPEQNIEFISYDEVKNKKFRSDAIWLGKGFAWTPDVAQRLYDEFMRNPESMQSKDVSDSNAPSGAFWLHSLGEGEMDIYRNIRDFEGHTLITGVTGAGKTRTVDTIIAQLLLRKDEPMIMIDPKNDNEARENIRKICEKEGRPFYFFHPSFPEKSCRIDALHSWSRVTQIADRIKSILPGASAGDSDPFSNIIWNVVNAIANCMVIVGERPSIVAFRRYMTQESMDDLIARSIAAYAEEVDKNWHMYYAPYIDRQYEVGGRNKGTVSAKLQKTLSLMYFLMKSFLLKSQTLKYKS
ncbi:helicase HerA domain-containing protein [Thiomicrorhabdus aquaedulcis]|uniref:helicase HerA domain-containing protein n=1 Tax=Thiomicrorhabdus aquaedulcis TaxID=2211106 RepID=UPI000FDC4EBA|nr:DUF87 domain-containing protein [Thiomicrorhabdus aquaedulcis]